MSHTSAAQLPVVSALGRTSLVSRDSGDSAEHAMDDVNAPLAVQPEYVTVQQESARMSLAAPAASRPQTQSLSRPPALTTTVQRTTQQKKTAAAKAAPATPEQRWRAVVAQVPLESARPFPTSMRPLVAQLAGSAERVQYTSGPATQRALNEVGALGATTGTVVHLSQAPSMSPSSMGVLAHELTHARSPISRPRFMLHNHTGSMDSDERHARSVGDQFARPTMSTGPAGVMVQRSLLGGLTDRATGAVSSLGNQATSAVGGLANQATSAIGSGASALSSQVGNAASGLSDRFSSAASDLGNEAANQAGAISAGLVDQLPVGGGAAGVVGAVSQMARSVVESAVRDAASSTVAEANQAVSDMGQAAQGMVGQLQGMAGDGVNAAMGQANQWVNGAVNEVNGAVQGVGDQAGAALSDAETSVASGVNGLMNKAAGALGAGPGAAPQISGQDLDRIAEALEERLLRQLERRGGRYAGVF